MPNTTGSHAQSRRLLFPSSKHQHSPLPSPPFIKNKNEYGKFFLTFLFSRGALGGADEQKIPRGIHANGIDYRSKESTWVVLGSRKSCDHMCSPFFLSPLFLCFVGPFFSSPLFAGDRSSND